MFSAKAVILNLGTFTVDDDPSAGEVPLAIPAGTYNHFSFTTDWSAVTGSPFSNQAIWAITDDPLSASPTFFVDPGPSTNGAANSNAVTLTWSGFLDFELHNPPTSNGFLLTLQGLLGGEESQWANTFLELSFFSVPAPPVDVSLGIIADEFTPLTFDTFGSDFDTELALFSATGGLIDRNDDAGPGLDSEILLPGGLPGGNYFLVLGGFNSTFTSGFGINPGLDFGDFELNVNGTQLSGALPEDTIHTVSFSIRGPSAGVPEPTGHAVFCGLAALACAARRKRRGR